MPFQLVIKEKYHKQLKDRNKINMRSLLLPNALFTSLAHLQTGKDNRLGNCLCSSIDDPFCSLMNRLERQSTIITGYICFYFRNKLVYVMFIEF